MSNHDDDEIQLNSEEEEEVQKLDDKVEEEEEGIPPVCNSNTTVNTTTTVVPSDVNSAVHSNMKEDNSNDQGEGSKRALKGNMTNEDDESTTATTATTTDTTSQVKESKKSRLQSRLRNLQLKINQSKKLNQNEVLQEGERLSSKEAYNKHLKQEYKNDKKMKEQEQWDNIHEKNVATLLNKAGNGSNENGDNHVAKWKSKKEIQALTQTGNESLRQSHSQLEKQQRNLFSTNDYYNPEGQFRNYERSLKSIHHSQKAMSHSNKNIDDGTRERDGAKRLANEMKRRMAKSEKRKQKEMEFEATDVTSINKRNKHFNEKISRNYDKHTVEIRQNLERGTAL